MRSKRRWLILSAAVVLMAFLYVNCGEFWVIDRSLDNGGCWDHKAKVCYRDEPHAQKLCDDSRN